MGNIIDCQRSRARHEPIPSSSYSSRKLLRLMAGVVPAAGDEAETAGGTADSSQIRTDRGVALVTGASRGIGRVTALSLAHHGFTVAINFRAAEAEAAAVVEQIVDLGGTAAPFRADLSIESEAAGLVERVENTLGPLGVLVNNAGAIRDRLVVKMSDDDWNFTWRTNLAGPRSVSRAALRRMSQRREGRIINVSSVVGATGNGGQANYAAAKSALLGLTRDFALEAAPFGIPVNCVIPGYILTDATSHLDTGQQEAWFRRIPMARPATAPDVAELITYLATSRSTYVTGQCIAVDGGLLAFES